MAVATIRVDLIHTSFLLFWSDDRGLREWENKTMLCHQQQHDFLLSTTLGRLDYRKIPSRTMQFGANGQVTSALIEAKIFSLRQKYRRIEEHFDQQSDTAVLPDHQPVARRKHESRFDGCLFRDVPSSHRRDSEVAEDFRNDPRPGRMLAPSRQQSTRLGQARREGIYCWQKASSCHISF
jgi:hypothetical protein